MQNLRWGCALITFALGACGGSDGEPELTDETSLQCPNTKGTLPFSVGARGYHSADNTALISSSPRNKDEASDTLGNPGGKIANIYLDDAAAVTAGPVDYRGAKARTAVTNGLYSAPLAGEPVSLWTYDADAMAWQTIGDGVTGSDGYYDIPDTGFTAPNGRPVYSILHADGTCAEHYEYLWPAATKVVLFDIDGTLTAGDPEIYMELSDPTYVPKAMGSAVELTQAWAAKHYAIVYLTARPHVFREETRTWLRDLGFPDGPVITAATLGNAATYKGVWLSRMSADFGWTFYAAYGNAVTDIQAYAGASIALDHTFIVGQYAGQDGTVAIENNDFAAHIASFVNAQPDNQ